MRDKENKGDKEEGEKAGESRIEGERDVKKQKSYIVNIQGNPEKYVHEV